MIYRPPPNRKNGFTVLEFKLQVKVTKVGRSFKAYEHTNIPHSRALPKKLAAEVASEVQTTVVFHIACIYDNARWL